MSPSLLSDYIRAYLSLCGWVFTTSSTTYDLKGLIFSLIAGYIACSMLISTALLLSGWEKKNQVEGIEDSFLTRVRALRRKEFRHKKWHRNGIESPSISTHSTYRVAFTQHTAKCNSKIVRLGAHCPTFRKRLVGEDLFCHGVCCLS